MTECLITAWAGAWISLAAAQCANMPSTPTIEALLVVYNPAQAFAAQGSYTIGGASPVSVPVPPGTNSPLTMVVSPAGSVMRVSNFGNTSLKMAVYFPGGPAVGGPESKDSTPVIVVAGQLAILTPFRAGQRAASTMLESYRICSAGGAGSMALFQGGAIQSLVLTSNLPGEQCVTIPPKNYQGSTVYWVNTSPLSGPDLSIQVQYSSQGDKADSQPTSR